MNQLSRQKCSIKNCGELTFQNTLCFEHWQEFEYPPEPAKAIVPRENMPPIDPTDRPAIIHALLATKPHILKALRQLYKYLESIASDRHIDDDVLLSYGWVNKIPSDLRTQLETTEWTSKTQRNVISAASVLLATLGAAQQDDAQDIEALIQALERERINKARDTYIREQLSPEVLDNEGEKVNILDVYQGKIEDVNAAMPTGKGPLAYGSKTSETDLASTRQKTWLDGVSVSPWSTNPTQTSRVNKGSSVNVSLPIRRWITEASSVVGEISELMGIKVKHLKKWVPKSTENRRTKPYK